jgi:hypothetical protein
MPAKGIRTPAREEIGNEGRGSRGGRPNIPQVSNAGHFVAFPIGWEQSRGRRRKTEIHILLRLNLWWWVTVVRTLP